jgi:predicted nucleic acid-binding Zn ribbon protein
MLNFIGSDLGKAINKAGIAKQIEAVQVCDLWEKRIVGIFGAQVAEKSQALHFKNGVLTVAVLSPVLAQEFRFKEEEIMRALNQGRMEKVRKLRFET